MNWGCIKTNIAIFGRMNIHLPVIWGSLGYQGFDSYPIDNQDGMLKQQKLADSSAMADESSNVDQAWKVAAWILVDPQGDFSD